MDTIIILKAHIYLYNDDKVTCNIFAISLDNHAKKKSSNKLRKDHSKTRCL